MRVLWVCLVLVSLLVLFKIKRQTTQVLPPVVAPPIDEKFKAPVKQPDVIAAAPAPQLNTVALPSQTVDTKDPTTDRPVGLPGLQITLPANLNFSNITIGGGVLGIFGEDAVEKLTWAMIATQGMIHGEQVIQAMRTRPGDMGISNLVGVDPKSFGEAKNIELLPESGMGNASIWVGKNDKGEQVRVAYIPRGDRSHAYVVVATGPEAYFENHLNYIENALITMRPSATP